MDLGEHSQPIIASEIYVSHFLSFWKATSSRGIISGMMLGREGVLGSPQPLTPAYGKGSSTGQTGLPWKPSFTVPFMADLELVLNLSDDQFFHFYRADEMDPVADEMDPMAELLRQSR